MPEQFLSQKRSWMGGHYGTFPFNSSEHIIDSLYEEFFGAIMSFMDDFVPNEINFMSIDSPPYCFAWESNGTLAVSGPLYSVLKETSKKLNYSLTGSLVEPENIYNVFAHYRPDVVLSVLWSQLIVVTQAVDKDIFPFTYFPNLAELSKPIGVASLGHILYVQKTGQKSSLSYLLPFDTFSIIAIIVFLILLTGLLTITNNEKKCLQFFWLLASSLLVTTPGKVRRSAEHLLVLWLVFVMILQQYYDADLLTRMTQLVHPIVVDSLKELEKLEFVDIYTMELELETEYDDSLNKLYDKVGTLSEEEANSVIGNYEREQYIDYLREFGDRRKWVSLKSILTPYFLDNLISRIVETEKSALVFIEASLHYLRNKYKSGTERGNLHVSKDGSSVSPYFYLTTLFGERKSIPPVLDRIITCLSEAGIYNLWISTVIHGYKDEEESPEIVEFRILFTTDISGCSTIFFGGFLVCCLVFAFEVVVWFLMNLDIIHI